MEKIPSVLFEDDDIVVINKPAGLTVNKSDTTANEQTLQDWVESYLSLPAWDRSQSVDSYSLQEVFVSRAGIVHRIDKETSGVLLIAKNVDAFVELQRQFKERIVTKWYRALAHGILTPPTGEINVPIGRLPWNRKRFGVVAGGREAFTAYTVLNYLQDEADKYSYVELNPKTGRTHQIRVHLKYLNHPIVADPLYSGRKVSRDSRKKLERLFLHAAKIQFLHPKTHKEMIIESSLAPDLAQFLDSLQKIETK